MIDPIESFKKLNKLAEQQKEDRARLKGSMDQIARTLKERGYKNLTDANKDIQVKKKQMEKLVAKRDTLVKEFEDKYAKYL